MVPLLSNGGTFRTVCERATVSIKGSSSSPSDFSVARLLFRHQKSSGSKLLLRLVLANLRNRADRFAGGSGWQVRERARQRMPSNYNYTNLHMNVVFLTKRWTNSWQRVKECGKNTRIILLDCVNRDERKILWGEILQKRKGKEEKTQRTIKNYLFVTSRGYYYYKRRRKKKEKNVWNISGKRSFAIIYTAYTWSPS